MYAAIVDLKHEKRDAGHAGPLKRAVQSLKLASDEAGRLARAELGRYAAHALMMPYQAFHAAAVRARYVNHSSGAGALSAEPALDSLQHYVSDRAATDA